MSVRFFFARITRILEVLTPSLARSYSPYPVSPSRSTRRRRLLADFPSFLLSDARQPHLPVSPLSTFISFTVADHLFLLQRLQLRRLHRHSCRSSLRTNQHRLRSRQVYVSLLPSSPSLFTVSKTNSPPLVGTSDLEYFHSQQAWPQLTYSSIVNATGLEIITTAKARDENDLNTLPAGVKSVGRLSKEEYSLTVVS